MRQDSLTPSHHGDTRLWLSASGLYSLASQCVLPGPAASVSLGACQKSRTSFLPVGQSLVWLLHPCSGNLILAVRPEAASELLSALWLCALGLLWPGSGHQLLRVLVCPSSSRAPLFQDGPSQYIASCSDTPGATHAPHFTSPHFRVSDKVTERGAWEQQRPSLGET